MSSLGQFRSTNIPAASVRRRVVGLDLGKAADFTALAVVDWTWPPPAAVGPTRLRPVYEVPALKRWPLGTSYVAISEWMRRFFESPVGRPTAANPPPVLVVDETGVGVAVVDMLRETLIEAGVQGGLAGVTITAGGGASQVADVPGRWRVAKKQLASVLVTLFQSRRLKIAPGPETQTLIKEAQAFSVKITPEGNETFESWRSGDHDDLVLALALGCWAAETLDWGAWPPSPHSAASRLVVV